MLRKNAHTGQMGNNVHISVVIPSEILWQGTKGAERYCLLKTQKGSHVTHQRAV